MGSSHGYKRVPDEPANTGLAAQLRAGLSRRLMDRHRIRIYAGMVISLFLVAFIGALVTSASTNHIQMGGDFADYWLAAGRMAGGHSPYAPEMLVGPFPPQAPDRLRYPPAFAQLLIPLSWLPLPIATAVWLGIQIGTMALAFWIASRAGGTNNRLDRAIAIGLAFSLFLPIDDSLIHGNVEGPIALAWAVALAAGEANGGIALAVGAVIKVVPGLGFPAAVARGRRSAMGLVGGLAVLIVPSILLAPGAWRDYAVVVPNMIAGSSKFPTSSQSLPDALAADPGLGAFAAFATPARLVFIGAVAFLIVLSMYLARRPGGWQAALLAVAVASILAPANIWYHYTVVLLPFAFFIWPRASTRMRLGLMAGLAGFFLAIMSPVVATLAFAVFTVSGLRALWPPPQAPAVPAAAEDLAVMPI